LLAISINNKQLRVKIFIGIITAIVLVLLVNFSYKKYVVWDIAPEMSAAFTPVNLDSIDDFVRLIQNDQYRNKINRSKIISFGEATHGTLAFRKAFVRLTQGLILKNKVKIVMFTERDFSESLELKDELIDNTSKAVTDFILFPYSSLIEKEFVYWVKNYNKTQSPDNKVWIVGGDLFTPKYSAWNALLFCAKHKIQLPGKTRNLLKEISSLPINYPIFKQKYQLATVLNILEPVKNEVLQNTVDKQVFDDSDLWLLQSVLNLEKSIKFVYTGKQQLRDEGMFSNLQWLVSRRPTSKIMLFGHNAHLEKQTGNTLSANSPRLGWTLEKIYTDKYFAIGSETEKGFYRSGPNRRTFAIPESGGKIGAVIARTVASNNGFLNLHYSGKIESFFNKDHYITYGVLDSDAPTYPLMKNTADAFDSIFWCRESEPLTVSDFNNFALLFIKSKQNSKTIFDKKVINVSVDAIVDTVANKPLVNDKLYLSVVYFANRKLLDLNIKKITPLNNYLNFSIPPRCDSLTVFLSGENIRKINLRNFKINNTPILFKNAYFEGANFEKKLTNDSSFSLLFREH